MSDKTYSLNRLTANRATLHFTILPNLSFMLTGYPLPAIMLPPANQSSPFFDMGHSGDKLEFEELEVEFLVSEYLKEWLELFDWMNNLANPHEFNPIDNLSTSATMFIYSSHNQPFLEITFEDVIPTMLGGLNFTEAIGETYEIKSNASFRYRVYSIKKLKDDI